MDRSPLADAARGLVREAALRLGQRLTSLAMPPIVARPQPAPSKPLHVDPSALTTRIFTGAVPETEVHNRTYIGRNVDLARIENAITWADHGMMDRMTDLSREAVFNDPHLAGLLLKRFGNLSVVDHDVSPASGDGINPDRAKEIADDCRQMLAGLRGFRQDIYDLGWALFDGRAALEIQWAYLGGRRPWRPLEIDWIYPGRLSFGPERELRVVERHQMQGYFRKIGPALRDMPGKFIWWTPRMFADYQEREGLAPRCMYWAFFKRFSWRHRMMLTELFGLPWRIVEIDKDAQGIHGEQVEDAKNKADALGGATAAAFPPGMKLRVESPHPESGGFFGMTSTEVNAEMSKLVSGSTTPMESDSNRASAVVGATQQDIIFQRDGNGMEERWEDQLIKVYVELNHGYEMLPYAPRFTLRTQPPRDRKAELERVEKVISFGADVAEAELREISGLRQPTVNEKVIRKLPPQGGAPGGAPMLPPGAPPATPGSGPAQDVVAQVLDSMEKDVSEGLPSGEEDARIAASRRATSRLLIPLEAIRRRVGQTEQLDELPPWVPVEQLANIRGLGTQDAIDLATRATLSARFVYATLLEPHAHEEGARGCPFHGAAAESREARQPPTVNGSPEDLIGPAVESVGGVVESWLDQLVKAAEVDDPGSALGIEGRLWIAAQELDLDAFAQVAYEHLMRGSMLGSLDADWEAENDATIAPATFAGQSIGPSGGVKDFTTKPFTEAIDDFRRRSIVPRDVFDQLDADARRKAFTVAGLVQKDVLRTAHSELLSAIKKGKDLRDFSKALRQRFEDAGYTQLKPSHVETVFRTNVMTAYGTGRTEQMVQPHVLAARPYWQITGPKDGVLPTGRSRPTHYAVRGMVLRADDPFWQRVGAPPWGYNCFLPGTIIDGRVRGMSRAIYCGKAVEISTRKGRRLRVTAKHPIATAHGFVRAESVREGQQLVGYVSQPGIFALGARAQYDENNAPSAAEQVFEALTKLGSPMVLHAVGDDFHGEAQRFIGDVEVVGTYRNLLLHIRSSSKELRGKVVLEESAPPAPRAGSLDLAGRGIGGSSSGSPRTTYLALDRGPSHAGPLDALCFGSSANLDVPLPEEAHENARAASLFFSQLLQQGAGSIEFDEVINVLEFDWSGHVYDVATSLGWLVADGLVVGNCRDRIVSRSEADLKRLGLHVSSGNEITGLPDPGFESRKLPPVKIPAPEAVPQTPPQESQTQPLRPAPLPRRQVEQLPLPATEPVVVQPAEPFAGTPIPARPQLHGTVERYDPEEIKASGVKVFGADLPGVSGKVFNGQAPTVQSIQQAWSPDGMTARVVRMGHVNDEVAFAAIIEDAEGARVGHMKRSFYRDGNTTVAHHELFEFEEEHQGKGLGAQVLRRSFDEYERIGVERVDLDAQWTGRYTWARFGFNWDATTAKEMRGRLRDFLVREGVAAERAEAIAAATSRRAASVAELEVDGMKLGKQFLLDSDTPPWKGSLPIKRGDPVYAEARKRLAISPPKVAEQVVAPPAPPPAVIAPSFPSVEQWDEAALRKAGASAGGLGAGAVASASKKVFGGKAPTLERLTESWSAHGYTAKLDEVTGAASGNYVRVSGTIYAPNGREAGSIERTFFRENGKLKVSHNSFFLHDNHRKRGIGESVLRSSIEDYRKLGVEEVNLLAGEVGRYTWARFGFSWSAETAPLMREHLEWFLVRKGIDPRRAADVAASATKRAYDVASLELDGRKLGKEFLLDSETPGWQGSLRMADDDPGFAAARARLRLPGAPAPVIPTTAAGEAPAIQRVFVPPVPQPPVPPGAAAPIEIPREVARAGGASVQNYEKIASGLRDETLDYIRDPKSFREDSFRVVGNVYKDKLALGATPTEIATEVLDPIRIDMYADGMIALTDGRHRYMTARKHGATAIRAKVRQYGPRGAIKWEREMVVPLR